jgi:hypothetical protein
MQQPVFELKKSQGTFQWFVFVRRFISEPNQNQADRHEMWNSSLASIWPIEHQFYNKQFSGEWIPIKRWIPEVGQPCGVHYEPVNAALRRPKEGKRREDSDSWGSASSNRNWHLIVEQVRKKKNTGKVATLIILKIFIPPNNRYQLKETKMANSDWLKDRLQHRYNLEVVIL